jgi:hypothetical protein
MAYQFADGFDNYANSYVLVAGYPWDIAPNGASTISTADFRFTPPGSLPGACMINGGSGNVLRKTLSSTQSILIVGVGFKPVTLSLSSPCEIVSFWDGGTEQICLTYNLNGALQFFRGSATGTAIGPATANGTVVANTWYGLAMQVVIATGTAGSVSLYVNGSAAAAITASSLNTSSSGNNFASQVGLGGNINAAPNNKFDDFYCFDSTGGTLNSLPSGDSRILTKMPSAAGTYTNWTGNGNASPNNYLNAAELPPNTTDYNANNVATTKDSYTMQSASLGVSPYFVVARASMDMDDAGPHTPSLFVRSSSVDSTGVVTPALTSGTYKFYDAYFPNDPATSSAWTSTGADNAQAGVIEG